MRGPILAVGVTVLLLGMVALTLPVTAVADPGAVDRPWSQSAAGPSTVDSVGVPAESGGPAVVSGGPPLPGTAAPAAVGGGEPIRQQDPDGADSVYMRIDHATDGDARWELTYRFHLDDENATAAFEDLQGDVRANRSAYESTFADRMERTAAAASEATGRHMTIDDVTVETDREQVPRETGIVRYRLEWTNFASVQGDRIRSGDAIDGLFLDEDTSLSMGWPSGYRTFSVDPDPDQARDDEVVWNGPRQFETGAPRAEASLSADSTGPTATGAEGPTTPTSASPRAVPGALAAALVAALLTVGGIAGYRRWTRRTATGGSGPPDDLLSDEERVRRLLEDSGGRVKQATVAEELDWTDAKTSRVVNAMREDDELDVFRIGRENVVAMPDDAEVDANDT